MEMTSIPFEITYSKAVSYIMVVFVLLQENQIETIFSL